MSPNRIAGGSATNIIPDSCCLEIDIRTLPGQSQQDIIKDLEALCGEIKKGDSDFNVKISIIRAVNALETPEDSVFIKSVCKATGIHETQAAGFTTDGPHFEKLKAPIIIFGPGDGTLCHKPDEYIEMAAIQQAQQLYTHIASEIL